MHPEAASPCDQKQTPSPPEQLLSRYTGQFRDPEQENSYFNYAWPDHKKTPRNLLIVGGMLVMLFSLLDLQALGDGWRILLLFCIRLVTALFLMGSAWVLHRSTVFSDRYLWMGFADQLVVAASAIVVGYVWHLSFEHSAFVILVLTMVFYQFVGTKLAFTLVTCILTPIVFLGMNLLFRELNPTQVLRFALYLVLANGLGVATMISFNRLRRKEYLRLIQERRLNQDLTRTVEELRRAQSEVHTLQGLIPICSYCKKIRDDQGYWQQVEQYLYEKAGAEFSHSLCPQCLAEHFPQLRKKS